MRVIAIALTAVALTTSAFAQGVDLRGMYDADADLVSFQTIGDARLERAADGTSPVIHGTVMADDGTPIPYEAHFWICEDTGTSCANIHFRHDWYADRDQVWCAINRWDETAQVEGGANAAFAFDRVRLIREQMGFEGARVPSLAVIVANWAKELRQFHAITQQDQASCPE